MSVEGSFKIAIAGPGGCGKTCTLLKLTSDKFDAEYVPTIQDVFETRLTVDGKLYNLGLVDTAGQDDLETITKMALRDVDAVVLIFAVNSKMSFSEVDKFHSWIIPPEDGSKAKVVICGNKCDMVDERVVTEKEARDKAEKLGAAYFETSAKTGRNIKAVFEAAVRLLTGAGHRGETEGGCCMVA